MFFSYRLLTMLICRDCNSVLSLRITVLSHYLYQILNDVRMF